MTDPTTDEALRAAAAELRTGNLPAARTILARGVAAAPDSAPLHALAGMLACQAGDLDAGAGLLGRAVELVPGDGASRLNLGMALAQLGRLDAAQAALAPIDARDPRAGRIRGYVHQQRGENDLAVPHYQRAVGAFPQDFESWNNLGNAQAATGDADAAARAFRRALDLRDDQPILFVNAAKALALAGRHGERRALLRQATLRHPDAAAIAFELGLAEASERDTAAAEAALRRAIALDPRLVEAYLELGLLLETLNRLDEVDALIAAAAEAGISGGEFDFLKAWALRRAGRFDAALPLAQAVPDTIDPIRRAQLLGEVYDRLGDADRAFPCFEAMNRATAAATPPQIFADGAAYLADIDHARTLFASPAAWREDATPSEPPAPVFILGFPRSGTTLLDTLLMNVPGVHVMEELPVLRQVQIRAGAVDRLPTLDPAETATLRRAYFDLAAELSPAPAGARIIDKSPLHMVRAALIHRLFPDARIILVERHPCDVLLSCFMSNFQPNPAMMHFFSLDGAARLYDAAFGAWTATAAALPLAVHRVRYEGMVDDLAGEMRALLGFLDLPFDESVLDNRSSAAKRGHIRTASYAQVTEPIYRRSSGRWQRYRTQLAPIFPVIAPWVERMGYSLDE